MTGSVREPLAQVWANLLSRTLVVSFAAHFAFMGYTMSLPPEPKLTSAQASERIARFVIAKFPAPAREPEVKVERVRLAVAPPKVKRPLDKRVERPRVSRPVRKPPPPPVVAKKVTPPIEVPKIAAAPAPVVIASKPAPGETAQITVAAVTSAAPDGPEGPAVSTVVTPVAVTPDPATVASSEYEPGPDIAGIRRGYIGRLSKYFRRIQRYPRRARRAGLEGTVLLEIVLNDAGRIIEIRVARSSGHRILDEAAQEAVAALGTVPSPPGELLWRSQAVQIPFEYSLRS